MSLLTQHSSASVQYGAIPGIHGYRVVQRAVLAGAGVELVLPIPTKEDVNELVRTGEFSLQR